ncbi:hypothetical protein F0562_024599 [Nyssa sinensis]|uniref:RNA helicase n=1 Tax=Nyssa sinensis TaxID=561372 RepID=A0A5J5BF82_9ASTE|nr:hypothetical protein F0562_024599 [Nyssa sinensis]
MLLALLFANSEGNILVERFNGVPSEERLHWRSFLVKLGAENLKGVKNDELLVACHKSVYIVYTVLGDVSIFVVGKDEYDELALAEAIFVITSAVRDVCGKPPTERVFLDKYGKICLCLDEIVWKGLLENTDKDRIKRLVRLKPPNENVRSCSYTVSIRTSCSSPRLTRDQISLSFGDAYGNQVYAPRIDDPSSRTFERCSVDTFQIYGPCTYQICYFYLYRSGYDGWKPESVQDFLQGYVGIHSSGFRDFLLKPELLRAIVDSGFEHPSEVQHECIPQAILGMDVICQAKSGMGKTAVFVLSTLQQIEPVAGQICHEFQRFSTYLPDIKVSVFYGGVNVKSHKDILKNECPHIVVGTPGRVLALARDKDLGLKNVRHFMLDECDKMLESLDMRRDVQEIFKMTPHDKQVMMFSATLSNEIRPVCKKFMQDPMEIYVDDEAKLTLHGLVQHYIKLSELEKNHKLNDLLDALDFNQVVIFVKSVNRAAELNKLLAECNFPSICIHSGMSQEERLTRYKSFKEGHKRILVATDLVGKGGFIREKFVVGQFEKNILFRIYFCKIKNKITLCT